MPRSCITQSACATSAPCVLSKGAKECGAKQQLYRRRINTLFSYQSRLSLQSQLTTISHLPLPLAQVTLPGYLKVCHTATSSAPDGRGPGLGASFPSFPSFPSSCKSGIDTRTYQEGIPRYRVTTRSADGMWHNVHTPSEGMRPDR